MNIKMTTSLREIKRKIEAEGGTYKKCKFYLNGNDVYEVNGCVMTKAEMIEHYNLGEL